MPVTQCLQPESSKSNTPSPEVLTPARFVRHKRLLRALLLDDEPWFAASDLARLMNHATLPERVGRNLDDDQRQRAWLRNGHGDYEEDVLISESGVYATLIHFFHPENRSIRRWINREVVLTGLSYSRAETREGPATSARMTGPGPACGWYCRRRPRA